MSSLDRSNEWRKATRRFAQRCFDEGPTGEARWWRWVDEAGVGDEPYVVYALSYWAALGGAKRWAESNALAEERALEEVWPEGVTRDDLPAF